MDVDASAFDFAGDGRGAALCLHGLTGTPYEVRPLGEALRERGIRAVGPVLPGHAATPQALAALPYTAWLESAREELRALRAGHARVFAVGMSMGGLLSLALAAEEPVDALVVVGTPLRFHPLVRAALPLYARLHPFARKRGGSDIRDEAARRRHPGYDVMPMASVRQLTRLQRRVRGGLGAVRAPILVAHGAHDRTANPADARAIAEGVSSDERELLVLADSAHVCPVDFDGPALARATAEFLTRHL